MVVTLYCESMYSLMPSGVMTLGSCSALNMMPLMRPVIKRGLSGPYSAMTLNASSEMRTLVMPLRAR